MDWMDPTTKTSSLYHCTVIANIRTSLHCTDQAGQFGQYTKFHMHKFCLSLFSEDKRSCELHRKVTCWALMFDLIHNGCTVAKVSTPTLLQDKAMAKVYAFTMAQSVKLLKWITANFSSIWIKSANISCFSFTLLYKYVYWKKKSVLSDLLSDKELYYPTSSNLFKNTPLSSFP